MILTSINIRKININFCFNLQSFKQNTKCFTGHLKTYDKKLGVYLRAQSMAAAQTLLQWTNMSQHGTTGRRFVWTLQFSRGTDDRKRGNMSGPLVEQAVHRMHHIVTVSHSSSAPTLMSWTDCLEVCCLKVTANPSSAHQKRLQQKQHHNKNHQ